VPWWYEASQIEAAAAAKIFFQAKHALRRSIECFTTGPQASDPGLL